MNSSNRIPVFFLAAFLAATLVPLSALASPGQRWVGTWAASPMRAPNTHDEFAADTTVRDVAHISIGGPAIRVVLSNEFGESSLKIGAATVGLRSPGGDVRTGTLHDLTFNGNKGVTIPAGALVVSDPVDLAVPASSDLTVSLFVPAQNISTLSEHPLALEPDATAAGNQVEHLTLDSPHTQRACIFLKGIDVQAPASARAIVALGDSITDGYQSTSGADDRWPDVLARRLLANKHTANVSVLNAGISGNRLLHDGAGPNALARFDRDVLAQDGVRYLIVLEGINDIGRTDLPRYPTDPVTTAQILTSLEQIVARAHAHGILVYGATLTPFIGAKYASPAGEAMRSAENNFIRTSHIFDGIIDFDRATRNPSKPTVYLPADDSGDHLHPNDAGYKAMADSINLRLFEK